MSESTTVLVQTETVGATVIVTGATVLGTVPIGPQGPTGATGATGATGPAGPAGADGADGEGVPTGGTAGQVLTKDSGTDFDTSWQDPTGGGGGAPDDATYLVTAAHADLSAEVVVGATPGGELGGTWASPTVDATHSGSSHASVQAAAEATAAAALTAHIDDTSDAHDASAISIADAGNDFTATDVEGALAELQADHEADSTALSDHIGDTSGAHAATAISFTPAGTIAATTVQAAIEEVASEAGGGYTDEQAQDAVGAMVSGNTETGIAVTYDDAANKLNFVAEVTQSELDTVESDLATAIADGDASTLTSANTYADGKVDNTVYGAGWNGDTTDAPSKNAVYDEMELRVPKSLYDANSILAATSDNTPAALTVGASTFVGRKASGDISAMSLAEVKSLLYLDTEGSMFAGMDNRYRFAEEHGANEGYDEEFDGVNIADDTLPSNWSMINQDTSVYRQSFGAGRIDWAGGGDATNVHACVRSLPATTTFDAYMHTWGVADYSSTPEARYHNIIVLYRSGSGDFIFIGSFVPDITPASTATHTETQFFISHFTDADTQGSTLTGPIVLLPNTGPHMYWKITKASDSSYTVYASPDGGCWFTIASAQDYNTTLGGDPDGIGFAVNTVGAAHVGCEWFRLRGVT